MCRRASVNEIENGYYVLQLVPGLTIEQQQEITQWEYNDGMGGGLVKYFPTPPGQLLNLDDKVIIINLNPIRCPITRWPVHVLCMCSLG